MSMKKSRMGSWKGKLVRGRGSKKKNALAAKDKRRALNKKHLKQRRAA